MMNTGDMQNMQGMMGSRGGAGGPQPNQNLYQTQNQMQNQVQKQIYNIIQRQQFPPGWKATVDPGARLGTILQIVTALRLLKSMSVDQAVQVAMNFEKSTLDQSADRASYDAVWREKLQYLQTQREKEAANVESQMRLSNTGQMSMEMQQGAMQPGIPNGRPGQFQQGYANAQLQRSMQSSPMPIQQQQMQNFQQQQQHHLVGNNPLGPQPKTHPSQRPPNQSSNQPQPMVNNAGNPGISAQEGQQISMLAQQLRQNCPAIEQQEIFKRMQSVSEDTKKLWEQQQIDPVAVYFGQMAKHKYLQRRAQHQQMLSTMSGLPNNSLQPPPMPQNPSNSGAQQLGAATAAHGFDNSFGGSIQQFGSQILGLQQDGIRSQEEGQVVVPVSGTQKAAPQQSQGMVQPGQSQQSSSNNSNSARSMMNNSQFIVQQEKLQQVQHMQAQGRIQNAGVMQNQLGQQNNLQGQAGGLNNPVNQVLPQQSPAMPNLNKPLGPSTQIPQAPGLSQARQQAFPSQTRAKDAGSIDQHNQQQQKSQTQAGILDTGLVSADQSQAHQFNISQLPPELQQRLRTMPVEQQRHTMMKLVQNFNTQNREAKDRAQATGMSMPGPDVRLRQPQLAQGHQFGQRIPGQIPNMQSAGHFGPGIGQPQDMSTVPMSGQPNAQRHGLGQKFLGPNQQPMPPSRVPQGPVKPLSEDQIRFMDQQPFPPNILGSQVMVPPQGVQLWGELKGWVAQRINTMPPDILNKLKNLQALVFHEMAKKSAQQQQLAIQQGLVNQAMQSSMAMHQSGPAPPAPMIQSHTSQPPVSNPHATAYAIQQNLSRQLSAQELQKIRDKNPQYANFTDDQMRQGIMKRRLEMINMQRQNMNPQQAPSENMQRVQLQQFQRQAMLDASQANQGPLHQQVTMGQRSIPPVAPVTTPLVLQAAPQATPQAQAPRPSTRAVPQQQQGNKGTKRSNEDEVVEVPNPKIAQRNQQQQRKTQPPGKSTPIPQKPTTVRGSRDTPSSVSQQQQQSSQYELELRKQAAQTTNVNSSQQLPSSSRGNVGPGTSQPTEEQHTLIRKYQQMVNEVRQSLVVRKEVAMDDKTREQVATLLLQQRKAIQRAESMELPIYALTKDEAKIKDLIRARMITTSQFRAGENPLIDRFTLTQAELNDSLMKVINCFKFCMALRNSKQKQQPSNSTENSMKSTIPIMTANKSGTEPQPRQISRQNTMQKSHSNRENRAPAAPTSDKPPFSFNAQSPPPDGVPAAYGPTSFPHEKLNIPATKKRKIQNQSSSSVTTPTQTQGTPTSTTSPKSTKTSSPQMHRSNAALPTIKCTDSSCEFATKDFATKEDHAKHVKEKHQVVEPPIEDPLQWALEGIRIGLGIGEDGKSKVVTQEKAVEKSGPAAPAMKQSTSMQGLTPIKMEGGTPMSRVSTQQGYQTNLGLPRTPQQATAMIKTPSSDTKTLPGKTGQADTFEKTSFATKRPSTPVNNFWDDISISPGEISAYFPSDADLQCSASYTSLTPASTLSSSKSEKNSPKASDIGEGDGLDIHIAADDWLPPGFFGDAFPPPDPRFLDDELFTMGWDTAFGTGVGEDGKVQAGVRSAMTGGIDTFDPSLFSFCA